MWVNNFKAHAETKIEVRPITLFIGPNNSGKSSLGQALLLLRQAMSRGGTALSSTAQRKLTTLQDPYLYADDQLIDLGDFEQFARRGQNDISIGVGGNLRIANSRDSPSRLQAEFEVGFRDDRLILHRGTVGYDAPTQEKVEIQWRWADGVSHSPAVIAKFRGGVLQCQPSGDLRFLTNIGVHFPPTATSQVAAEIDFVLQQLPLAPRTLLNSVHPIFPLRGLEERGSPLTDIPARNLERMSVADRTVALLSMLAYDLDLQERLSDWLENLIDRRIKVPLLPGKRVSLLSVPPRQKGADSLFTNEGTGSNQLPFILVPIGITPPGETIFLTEPEAHLHPKLQSTLTSLLLELSRTEHRQFIIETHSEHVLHRVLHAVAKGQLSPDDLAIYYFEKNNEISTSRRLDVSSAGQVDGGLPGFFEQSLDELSDYLDAVKKS
jgi:energy-coupling factor transporter ATP-binding protein EcfA2